jgi:lipopolysaccharide/colanic/teichoic acid biosynthesis glycosyltransferase/nucleoside-diphosphate-sugar epimerase
MKRICDVLLAGIVLVLASPALALIAVLVKLDSRGPVIFRQTRIGKDGRPFEIMKFRTMVDNAYALGPKLTQKHDPRVTRIGQVLRWIKADELPQLVNVLKGEMSLVGPRPEDPHFVRLYTEEERAVLSVRPGIVGPSQILGRDELEKYPEGELETERFYVEHILPEKLATDLAYVRSYGLWGDLKLLTGGLAVTLFGALKLRFLRLNSQRILLLAADTAASLVVYNLAYGWKLEWAYLHGDALSYVMVVSLLLVLLRPAFFVYFGLYQNMLRYVGSQEFLAIAKAVTAGSVAVAAMTFMLGFQGHSRGVLLVDWGLLIVVLFGSRVGLKAWLAYRQRPTAKPQTVLIVGADDTGGQLANVMLHHQALSFRPVGFLDDDPVKRGATIHGVRVLGAVRDLPQIAAMTPIELVVILYPLVPPASLQEVVRYCRSHNIEYRLVPTVDRLLKGDLVIPELDGAGVLATPGNGGNGAAAAHPDNAGNKLRRATDWRVAANGDRRHLSTGPRPEDRCVLVTGGAGYIGSHVVRKLLTRGHRVRVLDTFLYGDHGLSALREHPRLEVIEGDIRHLRTMSAAVKGADSIIALAALVGDAACDLDVDETVSTNLEATQLLAEVCQRAGVRRVVFASSCSVYGANSELVLNEGSWLNPVSLYARSRVRSEEILLRQSDNLSVAILRLATVFGLSYRMRLDLLVNTFTANAFFDHRIRVHGGQQYRPNVHVQDAAEAFILLSQAPDDKVRGEVFNVGDDALNYSVLEIARLVQAVLPRTEIEITEESSDRRDYRVSFEKIRHVLTFRPAFTVQDGIREIAHALRQRPAAMRGDERYHNFRYLKMHGFPDATGTRRSHALASPGASPETRP